MRMLRKMKMPEVLEKMKIKNCIIKVVCHENIDTIT